MIDIEFKMCKWCEVMTYLIHEYTVSETEVSRPKGCKIKVEAQWNQKYNRIRITIKVVAQLNQKHSQIRSTTRVEAQLK